MTPAISFEVFPPKTPAGLAALSRTVAELDAVEPAYVSVTYGAGGTDRDRSFEAVRVVREAGTAPVAGHLTCVGQSRDDVMDVIERYRDLGVGHVVALRGDPPSGIDAPYEPRADGFQSTADLVAAIKNWGEITVSVSAYPERHPQSPTDGHDLDVLAAKVAAGADQAMTQMFFDNAHYLAFRERVHAWGIDVPIVPGIFPIHSFPAVARFAERCGATIPESVARRFAGLDDDLRSTHRIAAELAAEQITELTDHGVEQLHLYTLNKADLALAVRHQLQLVTA